MPLGSLGAGSTDMVTRHLAGVGLVDSRVIGEITRGLQGMA